MLHCCNANLLLITELYRGREEDFDESFNYSISRPDGEWVEYTDGEDEDQAQGINFYNLGGMRIRRRGPEKQAGSAAGV